MPVTMLEAAFGTVAALVVPALAVGLHAPLEHERSVPVAATVEIGERIVTFRHRANSCQAVFLHRLPPSLSWSPASG